MKKRDPKKMRALIRRRERQGLTWDELAEQSGIPKSTLYWWKRSLEPGNPPGGDSSRGFAEVEVRETETEGSGSVEVIVAHSNHRVRVALGFCPDHLLRVLQALSSC